MKTKTSPFGALPRQNKRVSMRGGELGHRSKKQDARTRRRRSGPGLIGERVALAMDIRTLQFPFLYNIEKFLPFKKKFTIDAYFRAIHPDYIIDYIRWAEAVYRCATTELKAVIQPLKQNYRITIPMKLLDGNYHWMLMDCMALQFDKDNNIITHLNTYTVVRPYRVGENTPLVGNISGENFDDEKWNNLLWKMYFTRKPFVLTAEQSKIVEALVHNTELSNSEIAELLDKKKNTIDAQNKQILERARASFITESFENVREVVCFLKTMEFFNDDYFMAFEHGNTFQVSW